MIGIGIALFLAYVGWIVFRVIKQPEQVAQSGLLPNPFDIVLPGRRPTTDDVVISTTDTLGDGVTVIETPLEPEKRLFRISKEPSLGFTLFDTEQKATGVNPLTGVAEDSVNTVTTVRYITRDEGFINDVAIQKSEIVEKRLSSAFLSGLYRASVGRYAVVGQYRAGNDLSSTAYSIVLEQPPTNTKTPIQKSVTPLAECRYVLNSVQLGQSGRDVESVQQVLIAAGNNAAFQLGVFDEIMKSAVIAYQKAKNVQPASGLVGFKTVAQLQKDCAALLPKESTNILSQEQANQDQAKVVVLPQGVYSVTMLDNRYAFLLLNSGGRNRGVVRDIVTGTDNEVYSLGFIDWSVALFGSTDALLTTRASGTVGGYAFRASFSNKSLVPVLQNITGLATLPSHDGRFIAYSSTEGGSPIVSLYELATGTTKTTTLETFAEKCTWVPDSSRIYCFVPSQLPDSYTYPDEWYKRGVDIADSLFVYDIAAGSMQTLDPESEILPINVDVIEVRMNQRNDLIVFRDWKTGHLWGYRLD